MHYYAFTKLTQIFLTFQNAAVIAATLKINGDAVKVYWDSCCSHTGQNVADSQGKEISNLFYLEFSYPIINTFSFTELGLVEMIQIK